MKRQDNIWWPYYILSYNCADCSGAILSSTVPLTNLLQKKDNDLLHAVTKTHIVIKLCNDKRVAVWNGLYDKAVDVSSNFSFHSTMPRRAGHQKNRVNPDVQTVSDFYRVTVY